MAKERLQAKRQQALEASLDDANIEKLAKLTDEYYGDN